MSSPTVSAWRARLGALCACALLALAFTGASAPVAPAAGSEGGAFNELSEAAQKESTQTQKTETTGSTAPTSNSKKTIIIAIVAAFALLIAIAFVIVRDARRVAPAGDGQVSESALDARDRRDDAQAPRQSQGRAPPAQTQPLAQPPLRSRLRARRGRDAEPR